MKRIRKRIVLAIIMALTLTIASTAFAVIETETPNGYIVLHDSWKTYPSPGWIMGHSSTDVYLKSNPSQTKYHYTRIWFVKDGHSEDSWIGDSGRVYGYNLVTAQTSLLENAATLRLRSAWGGVY